MIRELLQDTEERMKGAVTSLESDLAGYRTGRANPHLVDKVIVEMYGVEMPLNQMAVISVPEPQQIAIRPYDANALAAIERAIMKSDIGIMPNNDGKIIRLNIPRLTEERRRELSKLVGRRVENAKVAVRNVRRDAIKHIDGEQKAKEISEDDAKKGEKDATNLIHKYEKQVDEALDAKTKEVLET